MSKHIEVLPDSKALIQRSLELVLEKLQQAIAERNTATIALSGGSTPKPLYEALAQQDLPWEKLQIFWGDERYVPHDHPDSNALMARQAWLDKVPIPAANIHPMPTDESDPNDAATRYDRELRQLLKLEQGQFPQIDVMLLGMGDDGHTASLFPRTNALQVCDRLVTVGNKDGQPRITLTIPVINESKAIIFVVAGENKQAALAQIFAPDPDTETYPSSLIHPEHGELWWLLDQAAGANLPQA
ncbi:6-phosphogluconolactonase [Leptolyngbya sp. GB1-A1]|uniref:6-phosphogluconolactonase n=1 Tax=Leptolyngbya sp. GB1-A1 TaxID=2933908 RepID=UPI003298484F